MLMLNMTLMDFISKWSGKYIDVDGYPKGSPYQCWDLGFQYCREVIGCSSLPTRPGGYGSAKDIFEHFLSPLPQHFRRIVNNPNNPMQVPPAGSLVIWGAAVGGGHGDVAICIAASPGSPTLTVLQQNVPNGSPVVKGTRDYKGMLGWLIPSRVNPVFSPKAVAKVVASKSKPKAPQQQKPVWFKRDLRRAAFAMYLNRGISLKEYDDSDFEDKADDILQTVANSREAFLEYKEMAAILGVPISDSEIRKYQKNYQNAWPARVLIQKFKEQSKSRLSAAALPPQAAAEIKDVVQAAGVSNTPVSQNDSVLVAAVPVEPQSFKQKYLTRQQLLIDLGGFATLLGGVFAWLSDNQSLVAYAFTTLSGIILGGNRLGRK